LQAQEHGGLHHTLDRKPSPIDVGRASITSLDHFQEVKFHFQPHIDVSSGEAACLVDQFGKSFFWKLLELRLPAW